MKVPKLRLCDEEWQVLKIKLPSEIQAPDGVVHVAEVPDPNCLVKKAVINCSDLHSQKLHPAWPKNEAIDPDEEWAGQQEEWAREDEASARLQKTVAGTKITVERQLIEGDLSDDEL